MTGLSARALVATLTLLALGTAARGQISPGPLSRAHAKLEGSSRCLDCHDAKEGVATSKCLVCHEPLAKRIAAGKGLHARPDYRDCRKCHVEHQGTEFDLVYWGKPGRAAFDHTLTGHALAGKHARLACDQCHKTRSFLGAVTECASCHKDEHRGQFAGRACASCHGEQAWKPAPGFDHAKTSWPLTGRHGVVACERCHSTRQPDPKQPGRELPGVSRRGRAGVRELPRGRAQGPARQQLRLVPQHFRMEADEDHGLRPRAHGLPAHRTTRGRGVREVPRPGPTAACEARSVRRLPPRRPRRRAGAAGRRGALRELPRRPGVPARPLRCGGPREDGLPVAGGAPRDRVRRVSSAA